jgi:hypothetical protein
LSPLPKASEEKENKQVLAKSADPERKKKQLPE